MKKLISTLLLIVNLQASKINQLADYLKYHLTPEQKIILHKTFNKAKDFDLQYTMTAIAWQESQFGKYLINLSDPSFGVFHNHINSVARRHRITTKWGKSRLAEKLIQDFDFSFAEALAELKYWQNYHSQYRNWSKMVSSYNAGYKWNSKSAKKYLKSIRLRVRALKKYFKSILTD